MLTDNLSFLLEILINWQNNFTYPVYYKKGIYSLHLRFIEVRKIENLLKIKGRIIGTLYPKEASNNRRKAKVKYGGIALESIKIEATK